MSDGSSVSASASVPRTQLVGASLALLALGLVLGGVGLGRAELDSRIALMSFGAFAYVLALFILVFARQSTLGLLELRLGAWFIAYGSVVFGLATVSITARQLGSGAIVDKTFIPAALIVVAIGFTTWAVGYKIGGAHIFRGLGTRAFGLVADRRSQAIRGPLFLVGVFTVGVVADIVSAVFLGRYGYLGNATVEAVDPSAWYVQPLLVMSNLKSAALFGLAMRVFVTKRDLFWAPLLPVAAVAVGLSLITGLKESFVTMALALGVPLLLSGGRRSLMWLIVTALGFVLVVSPIVDGIRQDVTDGRGRLTVEQSLEVAGQGVFSGRYVFQPVVTDGSATTLERLRLIDNVALVMDKTPSQIPFRSLNEVVVAPITGLIPRLLWPEKPVRLSGYNFYVEYYEGGGSSSSAITLPGSLYLYGGVGIVLVGMMAVGFALRVVDDAAYAAVSPAGALLFLLVFNVVVKQEADAATFLAGLPVLFLSWIVALFSVLKPRLNPRQFVVPDVNNSVRLSR
jgi:hypothetical protein